MRWCLAISLSLTLVVPTASAAEDRTQDILTAWNSWADQNVITATAITIGYDGRILASEGRGRDPEAPYPLASLTKAITAVCLKKVAEEQDLPLTTRLGDLTEQFAAAGVALPTRVEDRPLSALITMSAGLKPDRTQRRFRQSASYGAESNVRFSNLALSWRGTLGKEGTYFYNNGSYALLGALLEGLTGTDNVSACRDRVFPEGHRGTPAFDDTWYGLGGFGGWQASTRDYTAFAMDAFNPEGDIATNLFDLPVYADSEGWHYGLGIKFRVIDGETVFFHRGAICRVAGEEQGAFFAYYGTGYAVTITYNTCGQGDVALSLDAAIFNAAQPL